MREALVLAFDREWMNRVHTYGLYASEDSFLPGSELAQGGASASAELALLEPLRAQLPRYCSSALAVPRTIGIGRNRASLARALELLRGLQQQHRLAICSSATTSGSYARWPTFCW